MRTETIRSHIGCVNLSIYDDLKIVVCQKCRKCVSSNNVQAHMAQVHKINVSNQYIRHMALPLPSNLSLPLYLEYVPLLRKQDGFVCSGCGYVCNKMKSIKKHMTKHVDKVFFKEIQYQRLENGHFQADFEVSGKVLNRQILNTNHCVPASRLNFNVVDDDVVSEPEDVVSESEDVVSEPEDVVSEPEYVVSEAEDVVSEPIDVVGEPVDVVSSVASVPVDLDLPVLHERLTAAGVTACRYIAGRRVGSRRRRAPLVNLGNSDVELVENVDNCSDDGQLVVENVDNCSDDGQLVVDSSDVELVDNSGGQLVENSDHVQLVVDSDVPYVTIENATAPVDEVNLPVLDYATGRYVHPPLFIGVGELNELFSEVAIFNANIDDEENLGMENIALRDMDDLLQQIAITETISTNIGDIDMVLQEVAIHDAFSNDASIGIEQDIDDVLNAVAAYEINNDNVPQDGQQVENNNGEVNHNYINNLINNINRPEAFCDIESFEDVEVHCLDPMNVECNYCHALRFSSETKGMCCAKGKVDLQLYNDMPQDIIDLMNQSSFRKNVRQYNQSMAFCSLGAQVHHFPTAGPPCFKISGQMHHKIGSLLPADGEQPKFSQIYFYDTADQSNRRQSIYPQLQTCVLNQLSHLMQDVNPYVNIYTQLRSMEDIPENMTLEFRTTNIDRRTQNAPTAANEVAVLISNENINSGVGRDIVLRLRNNNNELQRIKETHPAYDALMYPLLFPSGDQGWNTQIMNTVGNKRVSLMQYYRYLMMIRNINKATNPVHLGGNLSQQFWVDQFAKYECNNLNFIRFNQAKLRADLYQGVADSNGSASNIGRRIIVPSTFTGGPRYMQQLYLDAMAMIREFGKPDLFVTFTCNPKWPEITRELLPHQTASDRPDIVARVFNAKWNECLKDIVKRSKFGDVLAYNYTIEFQKRGLPHAHALVILVEKLRPEDYDKIVCAEIPDPIETPEYYRSVTEHMIHGPCGGLNMGSPCMEDGVCTKNYPKSFQAQTEAGENGMAKYRRRDNGRCVRKLVGGQHVDVDNRFVVPNNPYLSTKYNCHINVEICSSVGAVKYIYKYIYKGHDRASVTVTRDGEEIIDEIKNYVDARYVSAIEACYRLLSFDMHGKSHSIHRLPVHMPQQQMIVFNDDDDVNDILERNESTKLTQFFRLCEVSEPGDPVHNLTYGELPQRFRWDRGNWVERMRRPTNLVTRMYSVSPREGERFYLRILLHKVRGPASFEDVRTYNGVVYDTFKDAAIARGLLQDDSECVHALNEALSFQMPVQLRQLFATLLVFCQPSNIASLWNEFKSHLGEDYRRNYDDESVVVEHIARDVNKYLIQYQMHWNGMPGLPFLDDQVFQVVNADENDNQLIAHETNYDVEELEASADQFENLNAEQRTLYDKVTQAVEGQTAQKLFFVDGPGGTGKSYTYEVIASKLRLEGEIVITVASSGIAASLLMGGRTAHSRFKIPIKISDTTTCNIPKESITAELIQRAKLIIWDEAPMAHRHIFETLDRTMQDLLDNDQPFGGKVLLFGGDFRQILPVVRRGTPGQIVHASMKKSALWRHIETIKLTQNMRVDPECQDFANYLLEIGAGSSNFEPLAQNRVNSLDNLIHDVFGDIQDHMDNPDYFSDRVILSPTNESVDAINNTVASMIERPEKVFLSADKVAEEDDVNLHLFPTEFLHSLTPNGIATHKLTLKVGMPVMLLRNLNTSQGLCNGTRMIVKRMRNNLLECEIMHGSYKGQCHFIPRINMDSSDDVLPFTLRRRQFPLRPCFAMTINKSQGQTLRYVGLNLETQVFSHGQLYVAMSRVQKPQNLKIFAPNGIKNIVYPDALE